jgi:hypothetical protein
MAGPVTGRDLVTTPIGAGRGARVTDRREMMRSILASTKLVQLQWRLVADAERVAECQATAATVNNIRLGQRRGMEQLESSLLQLNLRIRRAQGVG